MAKVAFVLADRFEDTEFRVPYDRIRQAGHDITVVGMEKGEVTGKRGDETFTIEATPDEVDPGSFDALVVPGGFAPDKLRTHGGVVDFVRKIGTADRPVAAICHAGSLLIEARLVEGRRLTSYVSIRTDLENAGADWVDEEVVEDGNIITSRTPKDLDAFCDAILARLGS